MIGLQVYAGVEGSIGDKVQFGYVTWEPLYLIMLCCFVWKRNKCWMSSVSVIVRPLCSHQNKYKHKQINITEHYTSTLNNNNNKDTLSISPPSRPTPAIYPSYPPTYTTRRRRWHRRPVRENRRRNRRFDRMWTDEIRCVLCWRRTSSFLRRLFWCIFKPCEVWVDY